MRAGTRILMLFVAAGAWSLGVWTATTHSSPASARDSDGTGRGTAQSPPGGSDPAESGAVCPVVYQLDQSPSPRGYHYQFFGNAFFVDEQGYLLTDGPVLEAFRDGGQRLTCCSGRKSCGILRRRSGTKNARITSVDFAMGQEYGFGGQGSATTRSKAFTSAFPWQDAREHGCDCLAPLLRQGSTCRGNSPCACLARGTSTS